MTVKVILLAYQQIKGGAIVSHQVLWTRQILDEFYKQASLSDIEIEIMETRALNGWTRTKQAMEYNMSLSTLDRHIKRLKVKYDIAQKKSDILPPRKFSAKELYMDTH